MGVSSKVTDKRKALSFQRRVNRRRDENPQEPRNWWDFFSAFGTTFMALATLLVAVAQWRTAERQTAIADVLAQLEFAKSEGQFSVKPSLAKEAFRTGLTERRLTLAKSVLVDVGEGVRELKLIDVPVSLYLSNAEGTKHCQIELRGMYLEDEDHLATLWEPSTQYLQPLLMQFEAHGLYVMDTSPRVRLIYVDLIGRLRTRYFNFNGEEAVGSPVTGVPLYSGARSGGRGFYADDGAPETYCPEVAKVITQALAMENGKPGSDYGASIPIADTEDSIS